MKNSILLINFNHSSNCNNKEFLKKIYKPYFKSIVFYSDNPAIEDTEINFIYTDRGYYTHRIFDHFFNKYSIGLKDIDGIFYIHDDCIINTKMIHKFDTYKIFISDSRVLHLEIEKNKTNWYHHKKYYGLPSVKKIVNNPIDIIRYGFSDFFYLPNKYFDKNLIDIFNLYSNTFLEITIPSAINHIEPNKDNYQDLKTMILWSNQRIKILNPNFLTFLINNEYSIIHPIKFNAYPMLKEYLTKILL